MKDNLVLILRLGVICSLSVLLAGCGGGGSGGDDQPERAERPSYGAEVEKSSKPRFFNIIRDNAVEIGSIGEFVEAHRFDDDVTAIYSDGTRYWAGTEDGVVAEVSRQEDEYGNGAVVVRQQAQVDGKVDALYVADGNVLVIHTADRGPATLSVLAIEGLEQTGRQPIVEPGDVPPQYVDHVVVNDHLYVLTDRPPRLVKISLADPSVAETADAAADDPGKVSTQGYALFARANELWVLRKSKPRTLAVFDSSSLEMTETRALDALPNDLEVYDGELHEGILYLWKGETLVALDASSLALLGSHATESVVRDVERVGDQLWVGYFAGVDKLDPRSLELSETISVYLGGKQFRYVE